jgi:hypothetical protein
MLLRVASVRSAERRDKDDLDSHRQVHHAHAVCVGLLVARCQEGVFSSCVSIIICPGCLMRVPLTEWRHLPSGGGRGLVGCQGRHRCVGRMVASISSGVCVRE